MKSPVHITACSLLTPLDNPGGTTTWDALRADQRITTPVAISDSLLPNTPDLDRSIRLALAAVNRLNLSPHVLSDAHLFCGTSKGPITTFLAAADNLRNHQPLTRSQAEHIALGVGAIGPLLRDHLHLSTPAHTSVAACSSGLHALHRAVTALHRNECARALVVAADASLHPLFESSFSRLGVLAPADHNGIRRCEPFGPDGSGRGGFFLIEAAAALLLEAAPRSQPLALIDHTWIGADSTALIAIDPHARTLRSALRAVDHKSGIAFIHAHATGTAHDHYEHAAIHSHFPNTPIFSHKKWLGHSLGAAGLLSVALSTLSHRERITLTGTPVPENARSLTLAQGFGGHIALVTLRSPA